MRWQTDVGCPQKCGGLLDAYDEEKDRKVSYFYICPKCGVRGLWRHLGQSLHPAQYRPRGTS